MSPNRSKMFNQVQTGQRRFEKVKTQTIVQNGVKLSKVTNSWSKLSSMVKVGFNGTKGSKMVQNGPIWYNIIKQSLILLKCQLEDHPNGSGITRSPVFIFCILVFCYSHNFGRNLKLSNLLKIPEHASGNVLYKWRCCKNCECFWYSYSVDF